jgi:hypothetical protein
MKTQLYQAGNTNNRARFMSDINEVSTLIYHARKNSQAEKPSISMNNIDCSYQLYITLGMVQLIHCDKNKIKINNEHCHKRNNERKIIS